MKNTREMANEYRLAQWAEVMRARVESGLSIRAYCRREGYHPNRYFYWQRRLREAAAAELLPVEVKTPQPVPSGWTQIEAEAKKAESGGIVIEIGKSRIAVTDSTDTELLTKICGVLMELC
jgi:hypothetical protein